jgi:hypothetical protein
MRISLYVEHDDLHEFYRWVNRLSEGHIESPTIKFNHKKEIFKDPLEIQLSANEYAMICDANAEVDKISELGGPIDITYMPKDRNWQMSTIRNILKNADRHNLSVEVIFSALATVSELPTITPAEAMIIAEGEWIK